MSKYPLDERAVKKAIDVTQAIEGYKETPERVKAEVQRLKAQYGIKVSAKR